MTRFIDHYIIYVIFSCMNRDCLNTMSSVGRGVFGNVWKFMTIFGWWWCVWDNKKYILGGLGMDCSLNEVGTILLMSTISNFINEVRG